MIRHLVFDMGNVIIKFDPRGILPQLGMTDEKEIDLFLNKVSRTIDWTLSDWGYKTSDELLEKAKHYFPKEQYPILETFFHDRGKYFAPIPGMADFLHEKKKEGYGIYLLSNACRELNQFLKDIPGADAFDGTLISADVKLVKPQPQIFQLLLDTYHLKAEECLFVDDLAINCVGAERVGMHAFLFKGDVEKLRGHLEALNA